MREFGNALFMGALLIGAMPAQAQPQAQAHWRHIGTLGNISLDYDETSVEDRGRGNRRVVVRITNSDRSVEANRLIEDIEISCSARTYFVNGATALTRTGEVGARFPRGFHGVSPISEDDPEYAVMLRICP